MKDFYVESKPELTQTMDSLPKCEESKIRNIIF